MNIKEFLDGEKLQSEGRETVSDEAVLSVADNIMDRYDDAFKELAK